MGEEHHTPEMVQQVANAIHEKQYGLLYSGAVTSQEYKWSKVLARAALDASAHHELVEALEHIKSGDITPRATSMLFNEDDHRLAYIDLQDIASKALSKARGQS